MSANLPYGRQLIEDDDVAAVVAALRSDYLAHGPQVGAFEQAFAAQVGARTAVACSSGTAALHLALTGLGVGPGDVCIAPAITFLATATAALMSGGRVVLADVDPETGLMTTHTLSDAIARAEGPVRAVLPVHLGGRIADVSGLAAIARSVGAAVVEDACHAIGGADAAGRPVGACAHSDAATFSFHPVKTLAAGEGGMVSLNDHALADRLRRLRNHGVTHDPALFTETALLEGDGARLPWAYQQLELGFNYRMDEMSAALGRSQLGKLDRFVARRARLADLYDAALAPLAPRVRPVARGDGRPGWHLYQVHLRLADTALDRAGLMRRLSGVGVQTQVHYIPLYRHPMFRLPEGRGLPGAEAFYGSVLALPLFPAMTDNDVSRVAEVLTAALA